MSGCKGHDVEFGFCFLFFALCPSLAYVRVWRTWAVVLLTPSLLHTHTSDTHDDFLAYTRSFLAKNLFLLIDPRSFSLHFFTNFPQNTATLQAQANTNKEIAY